MNMVQNKNNKSMRVINLFSAFCNKHRNAEIVKAGAVHYRTNPYNYIIGWLERNGVEEKKKTDIASRLMSYYKLSFTK